MHRPGIEPGPPAWQASILPLNQRCDYIRIPYLPIKEQSVNINQIYVIVKNKIFPDCCLISSIIFQISCFIVIKINIPIHIF